MWLIYKFLKRPLFVYLTTILLWLFQTLYISEIYLSINPPSQGNGEAYVSKIWFAKYWKTNKYKYRDKEFDIEEAAHKNTILYVGDSYVAGHGIKETSQRTPDLLESNYLNNFMVINAGRNGIGTRDEFKIINNFPHTPKLVVLTHVPNDINDVLEKDNRLDMQFKNRNYKILDIILK